MSTPAPPPVPTDPLREQLDELDALLQRMLELPVNPIGNEPGPPPALDRLPPPTPVGEPRSPLSVRVEPRVEEPPPQWPLVEAPPVPAIFPGPRPERGTALVEVHPGDRLRPLTIPLALRPLVWANRLFDRVVSRLGFAGRWLKRPWGRALLGWVGLLCLAAAGLLLLLDWIGWTW